MIIWYCDICGKRITDDSGLDYIGSPVWELSGVMTPIQNLRNASIEKYMRMIVCIECKGDVSNAIYKTIQRTIKDKKGKEERNEK
jgi:hypothetical protein